MEEDQASKNVSGTLYGQQVFFKHRKASQLSRETQKKKLEIVSEVQGWRNIDQRSEGVRFSRAQSRAQSRA